MNKEENENEVGSEEARKMTNQAKPEIEAQRQVKRVREREGENPKI